VGQYPISYSNTYRSKDSRSVMLDSDGGILPQRWLLDRLSAWTPQFTIGVRNPTYEVVAWEIDDLQHSQYFCVQHVVASLCYDWVIVLRMFGFIYEHAFRNDSTGPNTAYVSWGLQMSHTTFLLPHTRGATVQHIWHQFFSWELTTVSKSAIQEVQNTDKEP